MLEPFAHWVMVLGASSQKDLLHTEWYQVVDRIVALQRTFKLSIVKDLTVLGTTLHMSDVVVDD